MKRTFLHLVSIFVAVYTLAWLCLGYAIAADLHDAVSDPQAALDDIAQAKRQGWAVLVLAATTIAARALGEIGKRYGGKVTWLAVFARGRVALVAGAIAAVGASCYNAAAIGGSWMTIATTGVVALAAWMNLHADATPTKPDHVAPTPPSPTANLEGSAT